MYLYIHRCVYIYSYAYIYIYIYICIRSCLIEEAGLLQTGFSPVGLHTPPQQTHMLTLGLPL